MKTSITAYEVAAFTDNPAGGSPTGVVLDAGDLSSDAMQHIAKRLNFSHTAFVTELAQDDCDISIRFFTPLGEIKNCGHATIAAHYLRATQISSQNDGVIKQRTISGVQEVEVRCRGGGITVHLAQNEIRFGDVDRATVVALRAALKLPEAALHTEYPVVLASPGANRFLVTLNSEVTMNALRPDFSTLNDLCARFGSIGCFVFTVDSVTPTVGAMARMFAPAIGVDEDIINGNSSGCLGAYLLRLDSAGGFGAELSLSVHQGQNFNRPGTVLVNARGVGDTIETVIGGTAVVVTKSDLQLSN